MLFRLMGVGFFVFSVRFLLNEDVTAFVSVSAAAVFCFLYANFTKFKKFKGLGFEAELWEDKQAEAAALIDKLKEIVAIYSREVLLGRVRHGRIYSSDSERGRWKEIWTLHNELLGEHGKLGQVINFNHLKRELDTYFIFDAMIPTYRSVVHTIKNGRLLARNKIAIEFGNPIKDAAGHSKRLEQLRSIQHDFGDPLELVKQRNLSAAMRNWFDIESKALKAVFEVDIELNEQDAANLKFFAEIEARKSLEINDQLIEQFSAMGAQSSH